MEKEVKKPVGRPRKDATTSTSEVRIERVAIADLVFTPNVRHASKHNLASYDPSDIGNYDKEQVEQLRASFQERLDAGLPMFIQRPSLYKREDGKYEVQYGNTRSIVAYTYYHDEHELFDIVSRRLTADEKVGENLHFKPADIDVAYTIYNEVEAGTSLRKMLSATGWTEKKATDWLHTIRTTPKDIMDMVIAGMISKEVAQYMMQHTIIKEILVDELEDDVDSIMTVEHAKKIVNDNTTYVAWHQEEIEAYLQPWGESGTTIANVEYVFKTGSDMYSSYRMRDEDESRFEQWKMARRMWLCQAAGVDYDKVEQGAIQDAQYNIIKYMPYVGAGKAYWYRESLCSIDTNVVEKAVSNVEKLKQRKNEVAALEYAEKKVRGDIKEYAHVCTDDAIMSCLNENYGTDIDDPMLMLRRIVSGGFLCDSAVKALFGSQYQSRIDYYVNELTGKVDEKLDAETSKLNDKLNASVHCFYPTVRKYMKYIDWREPVKMITIEAMHSVMRANLVESAKKVGFKGKLVSQGDVDRMRKCIMQCVDQWNEGHTLKSNDLHERMLECDAIHADYMQQLRDALPVYDDMVDDIDSVVVQFKAWIVKHINPDKHYRVDLKWSKADTDAIKLYGTASEVLIYMATWIMMQ